MHILFTYVHHNMNYLYHTIHSLHKRSFFYIFFLMHMVEYIFLLIFTFYNIKICNILPNTEICTYYYYYMYNNIHTYHT